MSPITRIDGFTRLTEYICLPDYPNVFLFPNTRIQQFARIPEYTSLPEYPNKSLCPTTRLWFDAGIQNIQTNVVRVAAGGRTKHTRWIIVPPGPALKMDPWTCKLDISCFSPITQIPPNTRLDKRILSPEYKKLTEYPNTFTRRFTRMTSTSQNELSYKWTAFTKWLRIISQGLSWKAMIYYNWGGFLDRGT